jgi:hypothetical protein
MEDVGILNDHLVHFKAIWNILRPFSTFYGHLVYFMVIWYIVFCFGMLCEEKYVNHDFLYKQRLSLIHNRPKLPMYRYR